MIIIVINSLYMHLSLTIQKEFNSYVANKGIKNYKFVLDVCKTIVFIFAIMLVGMFTSLTLSEYLGH